MTKPRCNKHRDAKTLPLGCKICVRISLEHRIVRRTVEALLTAGYRLRVNDGESVRPDQPTAKRSEIEHELLEVDDEVLEVHAAEPTADPRPLGWVRFVYGNDGWDVISDYTVNFEEVLKPVNDYAVEMGG